MPRAHSEYKGVEISNYHAGDQVVVNIKGDWVLAKVVSTPTATEKEMKMRVEYTQNGTLKNETLDISGDAPRIVSEKNDASGQAFYDPEKGVAVKIINTTVAEDGGIEHTIKFNGQTYEGVTEEVLKLWHESANTAERLKQITNDLESKYGKRHLQFIQQNTAAEKIIKEIFAQVRDSERFNEFDKIQIEKKQKKLAELLKKADEAIVALKKEVDTVNPNQNIEEGNQATEAAKIRKMLTASVPALAHKISEKAEIQKQMADHAKANQGAAKPKKGSTTPATNVPPFQFNGVVPAPTPAQVALAEKEVFQRFLDAPNKSALEEKLIKEVEKLRKEQAKADKMADPADIEKKGAEVDYKKPTDKNTILTSKYFETTKELFDVALKKVEKKDDRPFDVRIKEVDDRAAKLLKEIPLKSNGDPADRYNVIHPEIETALQMIANNKKNLANELVALTAGLINSPPAPGELETIRNEKILELVRGVDELERELREIQAGEEVEKHAKEKKVEVDRNDEKIITRVDVPEKLMRELLNTRSGEVKIAVDSLFTSDISTPSGRAVALEKFRDIFDDVPPSPGLLAKLREHGIKNWEAFKKLWDKSLADEIMGSMHEMAVAMLRKEILSNINWKDKVGTFKGQIITRAALNTLLVGGSAFLLTSALSGGIGGIALAIAGGAGGGALKGVFSGMIGKSMKKKNDHLQEHLEESKRAVSVENLVENIMAGVTGVAAGRKAKMGALPSFAGVLAQGIRDITTRESDIPGEHPDAVINLKGNARVLYEKILAHVDTQDPDEKIKIQLAEAISKLNGKGDLKEQLLTQKLDSTLKGALDKFVSGFSGKEGAKMGAVTGGMVGAALFAGEFGARMAFSGFLGGWAGFKEGRKRDTKAEQEKAKEKTFADIATLRDFAEKKAAGQTVNFHDYHESLMRLKRLLHVSPGASQEELALYGIVGREKPPEKEADPHGHGGHGHDSHGHGGHDAHGGHDDHGHGHEEPTGWVDHEGRVIVDKEGNMLDPELKFLFQDMRSAVIDAERYGLLQEKPEDRQKLGTVLEQLEARGEEITHEIEEHHHASHGVMDAIKGWFGNIKKNVEKKLKKNAQTIKWTLGGVAAGLITGLVVTGARELMKGSGHAIVDSKVNHTDARVGGGRVVPDPEHMGGRHTAPIVLDRHHADSALPDTHKSSVPADETVTSTKPLERPTVSGGGSRAAAVVAEAAPGKAPDGVVESAKASGGVEAFENKAHESYSSEIKKGEGVLHAANRAIIDAEKHIPKLDQIMDSKQEFHNWKINELKEMGFKFQDGKWGYPFTVHKGATVEVYADSNGDPHLRLIGKESQITMHEYYKFKGSAVETGTAAKTEVSPDVVKQADAVAKEFSERHFGEVKVSKGLIQEIRVPGKPLAGLAEIEPIPNTGNVRIGLADGRAIEAHPEKIIQPGVNGSPDKTIWRITPVEHSPAVALPTETATAKNITESNIPVETEKIVEAKSVVRLTNEQYEKWKSGSQVIETAEKSPASQVETKSAAANSGEPSTEKPDTPEVKANGDVSGIEQKRNEFIAEIDKESTRIDARIQGLSNTAEEQTSFAKTVKEVLGLEKQLVMGRDLGDIENADEFYKNNIEPKLSANMKLLIGDNERLFTTPDSPKVGTVRMEMSDLSAKGVAIFESGVGPDGKLSSSMLLRLEDGTQFVYPAPEGYVFGKNGVGQVVLIDQQGKQEYPFVITEKGLVDPGTRAPRQAQR